MKGSLRIVGGKNRGGGIARAGLVIALGLVSAMPVGVMASAVGQPFLARNRASNTKAAPWALRYYTLRGAGIDFMLNHPEVFAKSVGGRPVILKNETYRRLADLARNFTSLYATSQFGEVNFAGSVQGAPKVQKAPFIGKPFFVGDSFDVAGFQPSRAASQADLSQILQAGSQWRLNLSGIGAKQDPADVVFWRSSDGTSAQPAPAHDPEHSRLIELMKAIAGGDAPFGFFIQYHRVELSGCGDTVLEDGAFPRYVNLRVAVLENTSGRTLRVGDFRGADNGQVRLRTASADNKQLAGAPKRLNWGSPYTLNPGERLVVPVRMSLSFSDYEYASPQLSVLNSIAKRPSAQKTSAFLNELRAKRKGFAFKVAIDRQHDRPVTMSNSALSTLANRPWRNPLVAEDFIYGPSYRLTGFKVSSVDVPSSSGKTQSINYTTADGFGSCPYLYIWDGDKGMWLNRGRILVNKVGPEEEATEICDLESIPSQISIREKEAEETHLTGVFIEAVGADGQTVVLRPLEALNRSQGIIQQGSELVFHFDVPSNLRGGSARLHISGYYFRKPNIQMVSR